MTVIPIFLSFSNAYLIKGDRPVLVDTGSENEELKITQALEKSGVNVRDLSLIVHTHAHPDHCGSSAALAKKTAAPLAIHQADAGRMQKGETGPLISANWESYFIRPFIKASFPAVAPNLIWDKSVRLDEYGIRGRTVPTPGHTAGSISIFLDSRDIIVGDVIIGGYLGGGIARQTPRWPYFADDMNQVKESLRVILALNPRRIYTGHGGPLEPEAVKRAFNL